MSAALHTTSLTLRRPLPEGLRRFFDEVTALLSVLLNPRRAIAEVEAMRVLLKRAAEVEARDPVLAETLRRRAARIGL
jgi:hypothetical protein